MIENMHRQITLSDIAASVHLSSCHFAHLFKQATGESQRRWLTRMRVERAERHLRSGSTSLTDIAGLCGFHSASHLSAAFSRQVGVRPGEYRRLMR